LRPNEHFFCNFSARRSSWLAVRDGKPFHREERLKSEEADLIERARAGDLEAFQQIHQRYGRRILNFIYRMVDCREDAEDLTQNVFFRAFHELRKLQDSERFESWLYRIARNEVYQAFRKRRSEPAIQELRNANAEGDQLPFELTDTRPTPQDEVLHQELGTAIRNALGSLPPKLREVFVLAVIHEMSYADISSVVGRSLLSVKTDIFRARSFARKALGRYLELTK
jgi:RNA polymerase sigma-70 factor (ECF subfamily)